MPALQLFFPQIFDIKYLMKFCDNLHGGLNKLAETLDVARIGPQHQVGCELWFSLANPSDKAHANVACAVIASNTMTCKPLYSGCRLDRTHC